MPCNRSWSYGKKEQGRTVGITELFLQYYERYLNTQHPNPTNREAFAFLSKELSGRFRNVPVGLDGCEQITSSSKINISQNYWKGLTSQNQIRNIYNF